MESNHPKVNFGKTGVLLINLGTPDTTGWWDIRKYLNEFLSDRKIQSQFVFQETLIITKNL